MTTDRPVATSSTGAAIGPTGPTDPARRATALRLARLHLRLGSLGLARAELEALAGSGELDEAALLDLAEVRWRTGDLPGAGEAANAALSTGEESVLALVIAAEASAAAGRPAEARRLAGQALERADAPLDRVFAGMPRSGIWPHDARLEAHGNGALGAAGGTRDGSGHAGEGVPPGSTGLAHAARVRPSVAPHGHPVEHLERLELGLGAPFDADAAIGAAAAHLAAGRLAAAAASLTLVARFQPDRAEAVLATIAGRAEAAFAVVRGDALLALGRTEEAQTAYRRAAAALLGRGDATEGRQPD